MFQLSDLSNITVSSLWFLYMYVFVHPIIFRERKRERKREFNYPICQTSQYHICGFISVCFGQSGHSYVSCSNSVLHSMIASHLSKSYANSFMILFYMQGSTSFDIYIYIFFFFNQLKENESVYLFVLIP